MAEISMTELLEAARASLNEAWVAVSTNPKTGSKLPNEITEAIDRSINSKMITYRYVLPTHVLAKTAFPELDCRSVQASCGELLSNVVDGRFS